MAYKREAVIGDLHLDKLARRIDNHLVLQFMVLRTILQRVRDEGIKTVILLGDVLDKPTVEVGLLMALIRFLDEYKDLEIIWIVGNHDRTSAESSQVDLIKFVAELGAMSHVRIVNKPLRRGTIGYLPYPHTKPLPNTWLSYAHVDRPGARTDSGRLMKGDSKKWREDHIYVIGHIHTAQTIGKTYYTGAPYQLSFGEQGDKHWAIVEYHTDDPDSFKYTEIPIVPQYRLINVEVNRLRDLKVLTPPSTNDYYKLRLTRRLKLPRNLLTRYPNAHLDGNIALASPDVSDAIQHQRAAHISPTAGLASRLKTKGFGRPDIKWAHLEARKALREQA